MGNCCGVPGDAVKDDGTELKERASSMTRSSSSSSSNSMELVDRREEEESTLGVTGSAGAACGMPDDYSNIRQTLAKRGTLSYGAAKMPAAPRNSRDGVFCSPEEKMPLPTLNFKRGKLLYSSVDGSVESDRDVEVGEDSSQLGFARVLEMWQEDKRARKKKRGLLGSLGLKKSAAKGKPGRAGDADGKVMMWETFLRSKKVTETNPAWRHAKQTYTSEKFKDKVEYLFASIDTNGVGFLEKHEFMFMIDGLRGRMHHFLRNTRDLYFTQKQDEVLPADQEFVLSEDFKDSLVGAIQDKLYTWRMTPHAWAVDRDLFENLVTLIFCSTIYLIMTDEEKSQVEVPVAIEFYLLMSAEGIGVPIDQTLLKSASRSSDIGDIDTIATSLFCKAIFSLHLIVPPQSVTYVDETVPEATEEEEAGED
ncbi:EF-hand domain-containing protein [Chloropicon roscoffensis]|uniref:EF-hand domain-containing protein n=1 Tax=Chloropicon roscoffensis TaxID=1461544 RepID=A0AAX4NXD5_9CHLO